MTTPDTIPEEVLAKARRTYDALGRGSISDERAIARAILSAQEEQRQKDAVQFYSAWRVYREHRP